MQLNPVHDYEAMHPCELDLMITWFTISIKGATEAMKDPELKQCPGHLTHCLARRNRDMLELAKAKAAKDNAP